MHAFNVFIRFPQNNIVSNATASVGAVVKNLCKVDPSLNFNNVAMAIAEKFSATYSSNQQLQLQVVDPGDEKLFPGISEFARELQVSF